MTFIEAMEQAAQALEFIGAVVLLAGLFVSAALAVRDYLRARDATSAYRVLRQFRNSGATLLSTNLSHDQEAKLPEAFVEAEQRGRMSGGSALDRPRSAQSSSTAGDAADPVGPRGSPHTAGKTSRRLDRTTPPRTTVPILRRGTCDDDHDTAAAPVAPDPRADP
jgi:hypothetical protein